MKNLLYIITSIFVIASLSSCKRLADEDGNLLNDMDANPGGLTGPRFLYQEVTSADTLAEYRYTGMKLTQVLTDSAVSNISYAGDRIYKLDYTGVVNGDSIVYTKFFNYDPNSSVLSNITEARSVFPDVNATTPPPVVKTKTIYNIKYNAQNKIDSVIRRSGLDVAAQPFVYTAYTRVKYDYEGDNVTKATVNYGQIDLGTIFSPSVYQMTYSYANYDDKKSPYSLLPAHYILSQTVEDPRKNYWFSKNNPKRITISDEMSPPQVVNGLFDYDAQDYLTVGYGTVYDYRPF